jgi:hypothetical protein
MVDEILKRFVILRDLYRHRADTCLPSPARAFLKEERRHLTIEALDDVEMDEVIDHHAVQAWADSLDTKNPLPLPR